MGYAISWLAVKDRDSALLLQKFELTPTGELAEYGDSLFTGRTLPSGWFVLFINEFEHPFVKPKALASFSNLGEVIACSVEEHVMWCAAELCLLFERGKCEYTWCRFWSQKGDSDSKGGSPQDFDR